MSLSMSCVLIVLTDHVYSLLKRPNVIKYLRMFIVQSRVFLFKCSIDETKRFFYTAANTVFGKIGRSASEEVVLGSNYKMCSHPFTALRLAP